MVLITLNPNWARVLISQFEDKSQREESTFRYLEDMIKSDKWHEVPPIWITPNFILNGLYRSVSDFKLHVKPFMLYGGHHRLDKAIEHSLPVRAYVRFTLGNPPMPVEERQFVDFFY